MVMVEHVLCRGRFLWRDEISNASDTHDSPFCRHLTNRFIGLTPWLIRIKGATICMSDQDRRFGNLKRIECRLIAAVRDIDRHSYLVHTFDDGNAEITDSVVAPLRAPVANEVAAVIREQRDALTELIEPVNVVWGSKMLGVLEPQNDADFTGAFCRVDA